jgi:hypothetical protein
VVFRANIKRDELLEAEREVETTFTARG